MRKKSKIGIVLLSLALVCSTWASTPTEKASAAVTRGGSFNTNDDATEIVNVFGGASIADISCDSVTLTINIKDNIQLSESLEINQKGNISNVVINLHGKTITGESGTLSSREGGDVLRLIGEMNLTINGGEPYTSEKGKLIGGAGYEGNSENQGGAGGYGIKFVSNSERMTASDHLPMITIDKGAEIYGGTGGDNNSGGGNTYKTDASHDSNNEDSPGNAGNGGIGIGDGNSNTVYSEEKDTYFQVNVKEASVFGGNGGNINCKNVITAKSADAGDGGNGIRLGYGKKYVEVKQEGQVIGGIGGDCNKSTVISAYTYNSYAGSGGIGISTNCVLSNAAGGAESRSLLISGTVKGGSGGSATGRITFGGNGGDGISIGSNSSSYLRHPVAEFTSSAKVYGGIGGNAVWGNGGYGGNGTFIDVFGTTRTIDGVIINGDLYGGNGGNSRCGTFGPGGGSGYPIPAAAQGSMGLGGCALDASGINGLETNSIIGSGNCTAGNCGSTYNDINNSVQSPTIGGVNAINTYYSRVWENSFSGNTHNGAHETIKSIITDGTKAVISPNFTGLTPKAGNTLTCKVTLPGNSEYTGDIYYDWHFEDNTTRRLVGTWIVEPAIYGIGSIDANNVGNIYTFENTLLNPSLDNKLTAQSSYGVYCYVVLENGVTVKSNTIWFDSKLYNSNSQEWQISLAPPKSVKAQSTSNGRIKISWEDTGTQYAHSYSVYKLNENGYYRELLNDGNVLPTIYKNGKEYYCYDKECIGGKTYSYKIKTINSNGTAGPISDTASAVAVTPPSTPKNFSLSLYSNYLSVKCTWSPVAGVDGYIIRLKRSDGSYIYYKVNGKTNFYKQLSYVGKKYYAAIKSYKKIDGITYYSTYSSSDSIYTLRRTSINLSEKSRNVTVGWVNISGESGYQIYRKIKGGSWKKVKTCSSKYSSWKDSGKSKNKYYYYKVRAYKTVNGKYIYAPFSYYKRVKI